jgi:hypothetical protein
MANFTTKKNQRKNGNDVQDSPPPPYGHTIANVPYTCNHQNNKRHDQKYQIPFSRIQSHQNSYFPSAIRTWNNLPAVLIGVPTLEASKVELARV